MQLARTSTACQAHVPQCRNARNAAHAQPARQHVIARSFQEGGMFNDSFKAALQDALSRDRGASSDFSSSGGGYSSSYDRDSYSRPSPAAAASQASPLLQILATALGQSRATLERLQAEEAEIENLIQKEQKQVERLEWLLEKVQQDYSYFNALQRRFEQESSGSGNSGRW